MRSMVVRGILLAAFVLAAPGCSRGDTAPAAMLVNRQERPALMPLLPVLMLRASMEELDLSPARQAALERIEASLVSDTSKVRQARVALLRSLATDLENGTFGNYEEQVQDIRRESMAAAGALEQASARLFHELTTSERAAVGRHLQQRWPDWQSRWHVLDQDENTATLAPGAGLFELSQLLGLSGLGVMGVEQRLTPSTSGMPTEHERERAYRDAVEAFSQEADVAFLKGIAEQTATSARASAEHAVKLVLALSPAVAGEKRELLAAVLRQRARQVE